MLKITNLHAGITGKTILNGVTITVRPGEIHAIMGPNGSGKSTLAYTLAGHPKYSVSSGSVTVGDTDILALNPEKRAREGLLLAFQHPQEIPGVSITAFMQAALNAIRTARGLPQLTHIELRKAVRKALEEFSLPSSFMSRSLNDGFSGGEKKKLEIMQLSLLEPKFAVFDELDSGLDVDALKACAEGIGALARKKCGVIIITHYQRILKHIKPDKVHIFVKGEIVNSGNHSLAKKLEREGYKPFLNLINNKSKIEQTILLAK